MKSRSRGTFDLDKLGFLVSDRWRVYKQIVGERSGYRCEFCKIRMMDTAHHRINERPPYGYDQPPLLDLMAICFVCHEFIHRDTSTKTDEPKFGVNSPGDLKDRGFSTSNDTPGHWKKFWPENPWKAILPNHGQVIYQAYKEDFSNGNIKLINKFLIVCFIDYNNFIFYYVPCHCATWMLYR